MSMLVFALVLAAGAAAAPTTPPAKPAAPSAAPATPAAAEATDGALYGYGSSIWAARPGISASVQGPVWLVQAPALNPAAARLSSRVAEGFTGLPKPCAIFEACCSTTSASRPGAHGR